MLGFINGVSIPSPKEYNFSCYSLQSYGIKVGYGGIPGPSGGRDGAASQGGACCSWNWKLYSLNLIIASGVIIYLFMLKHKFQISS